MKFYYFKTCAVLMLAAACLLFVQSCKPKTAQSAAGGDAAKSFVAPGKYDEFYNIVSGGFNGQIGVYGIPSGRLIPHYTGFLSKSRKAVMVLAKKQNQC